MRLFNDTQKFFKCNFHTHTTVSDGRKTPDEVIEVYKNAGYDVLALTDHWKICPQEGMHGNMLVLHGAELDTMRPEQAVHIVGVGIDRHADLEAARDQGEQALIDCIRQNGGRAILAHPAWSLNTPDMISSLRDLSATEIYNSISGLPWNGARADSSSILDMTFSATAHYLPLVANDDAHFYTGEQCFSFTMLQMPCVSRENVLKALDEGAFYASQGPQFRQVTLEDGILHIECEPTDMIVVYSNYCWSSDRVASGGNLTQYDYHVSENDRFLRVELVAKDGKRAWTSPIAVK